MGARGEWKAVANDYRTAYSLENGKAKIEASCYNGTTDIVTGKPEYTVSAFTGKGEQFVRYGVCVGETEAEVTAAAEKYVADEIQEKAAICVGKFYFMRKAEAGAARMARDKDVQAIPVIGRADGVTDFELSGNGPGYLLLREESADGYRTKSITPVNMDAPKAYELFVGEDPDGKDCKSTGHTVMVAPARDRGVIKGQMLEAFSKWVEEESKGMLPGAKLVRDMDAAYGDLFGWPALSGALQQQCGDAATFFEIRAAGKPVGQRQRVTQLMEDLVAEDEAQEGCDGPQIG